jgi:hypothetical protein
MVQHADEKKIPPSIGEQNFESELKRSISELSSAKPGPLIRFLPLILDKLFELMVQPPIVSGQLGMWIIYLSFIFEIFMNKCICLQSICM